MTKHDYYDDLSEHGVFDGVSDIGEVKRIYRNQQKALWRKHHRKRTKAITITLSPHDFAVLTTAASRYRTNRTRFIYAAAMAQATDKRFLPNHLELQKIQEAIWVHLHFIRDMKEDGVLPDITCNMLLQKLSGIEALVTNCLTNPQSLISALSEQLQNDPAFADIILTMINNTSCR